MSSIRFHIADDWTPPRQAVDEARAPLGIEVDGVDIAAGRIEDRVVPSLASLIEAIARLAGGQVRAAAVHFDEGGIELLLVRRGDTVALSLVSLPRPARVLVRDLEVELEPLVQAAARGARDLLSRLEGEGGSSPAVRRLRAAARSLHRSQGEPGDFHLVDDAPFSLGRRPPAGGTQAPSIGFDLRDDGSLAAFASEGGLHALLAPGHVYLHAPDGEELCAVAGTPFLLLRDLADAGLRLLEALRDGTDPIFTFPLGWDAPEVEVDLQGQAFTVAGRTLRCAPEDLARALFSGARDLCGALIARQPRLADNAHLALLLQEARARLALCDQLQAGGSAARQVQARAPTPRPPREEAPLAPGRLRRVTLRRIWQRDVGAIRRLHPGDGCVWVVGPEALTRIPAATDEDGDVFRGTAVVADPRAPVLLARGNGRLLCFSPGGRLRWEQGAGVERPDPVWVETPGAIALADGAEVHLLDRRTGARRVRFAPPTAVRLRLAAAGALLAVGADNGMLYGVDARVGEVAWTVPSGFPAHLVALGEKLLVVEGDTATCFHAGSGERLFEVALPFEPAEILPLAGGWALAGAGMAGGEVLLLAGDGTIRWRARPNLGGGAPGLLRAPGAIYARGEAGICRIERGKVRWNAPCPPGGAPVLLRGLLALPGERLVLLEAATGEAILTARPEDGLPHADHLLALDGGLVVADAAGEIAWLQPAGALAVVR